MTTNQSNHNFAITHCKASSLPPEQSQLTQWQDDSIEQSSTASIAKNSDAYPYRSSDQLQAVYNRTKTIAGTAERFEIAEATARKWLIHHGIYDPETDGLSVLAEQLEEIEPEDLGLKPLGER